MSDLAQVFKNEIQRLARKELRQHVEPLKKRIAQQRSDIAALRRAVEECRRRLGNAERRSDREIITAADDEKPGFRFSAKGFRARRDRMKLSVKQMGQLLGVSGATIYNWETGKTRPRSGQLAVIAEVRTTGKRELLRRLESVG